MDEIPPWRACAICCRARRANASHCKRISHFREISANASCCNFFEKVTQVRLRQWAQRHFEIPADQSLRTITPLTRAPVPCSQENLLFIGDAARVVEPFTGEGIYYALRSGELAASAIAKIIGGKDRQFALREFARASAEMYWGRLWINRLARASVLSPRIGSLFVRAARINPSILKLLTTKIVYPKKAS